MSFKATAKSNFKGLTAFKKKLKTLDGSKVTVGYFSEQKHPDIDMNLAELAYIHENGTPQIPQRDFMTQSWDNWVRGYAKGSLAKVANDYLFYGKKLRPILKEQGLAVKWMIDWTVEVAGDFTPNSPKTIAEKVGNSPLIDSGYLKANAKVKVTFNGK